MAAKTIEERIALIDQKIEKKKAEIENLEATKQKLLHPVNMKTVMAAAKEEMCIRDRNNLVQFFVACVQFFLFQKENMSCHP